VAAIPPTRTARSRRATAPGRAIAGGTSTRPTPRAANTRARRRMAAWRNAATASTTTATGRSTKPRVAPEPIDPDGRQRARRHPRLKQGNLDPGALQGALSMVQAHAEFEGREDTVYARVAEKNGAIYLDLG